MLANKGNTKLILFTVDNCPKCNEAKRIMKERNIIYREVNVMETRENFELALSFNVKIAGTVINEESGDVVDVNNKE